MPDALRAADAVLAFTDYEASPMIVKEALACERPIAATDVGDLRERFAALPALHLAAPDPLYAAQAARDALAAPPPTGGRDAILAQGLTLDRVASRLVDLYNDLLAHPPAGVSRR